MRTKTFRLLALLLLVAAVGLTGCMADDDDGDEAAGTTTHSMEDMDVTTSSPAADLRVTLGTLLGEHALLAQFATQKGLKGAEDFEAIGAALDANSVELSEAIGSVYGAEAAETFLDGTALWRDHISFFVDYTTALAKKDKAGQDKAVNDLMGYVEAFSSFLADATGLPKDALRDSISEHVDQLKGQIDAFAAGDYERAYTLLREATHHMWMTGDRLAEAIVAQSPDGFSS
jgi:hypothetical protein